MRQRKKVVLQNILVVAAAVLVTSSTTTQLNMSPPYDMKLANAKPVLGLTRPVKPVQRQYWELVQIQALYRKSNSSQ